MPETLPRSPSRVKIATENQLWPSDGLPLKFIREMIRYLNCVLAGVLLASAAFVLYSRADTRSVSTVVRSSAVNWSAVSSRDLNIASVFLTARERGVRKALDSLEVLAAADARIRVEGHDLAHALGRFAVAEKQDIQVLAQCRVIFEAGCYHGVLEGYLASRPKVTPAMVASLCDGVQQSNAARLPALECAHGLGHGLLMYFGYSVDHATHACDALTARDARRECLDGVFMENAGHGMEGTAVNSGDAAVAAHQHGMSQGMSHDMGPRVSFRANELAFPCDSVASAYQPSCWSYQPLVIMALTGRNAERTIMMCDAAPEAARTACYRGVGKQATGWYDWNTEKIVQLCAHGAPPMVGACIAGGVEAHVDETWTADGALTFCASVPESTRTPCYAEIGARMRLVLADDAALTHECARAPQPFVAACLEGTRHSEH